MSWPMTETSSEVHRPIRDLTCCCCGSWTRGRQWWNRDTGFGLCDDCHDVNGVAHVEEGVEVSGFGIRGVHWGLRAPIEIKSKV